jgi:hypothetical protein
MHQSLHTQLVSIASIDVYRRQISPKQLQPCPSSAKRSRNRGVILSRQGWQKLMQAGALYNEVGERCTYGQLSERSHLDERTISRLLSCEVKVDKSTLKAFFHAFDLALETDDYILSNNIRTSSTASQGPICGASTKQMVDVEQLVEELNQLKQRMREYERLFHRLGLNENYFGQQLGA